MAAKVHGWFPLNTSMKNSEIINHSDLKTIWQGFSQVALSKSKNDFGLSKKNYCWGTWPIAAEDSRKNLLKRLIRIQNYLTEVVNM